MKLVKLNKLILNIEFINMVGSAIQQSLNMTFTHDVKVEILFCPF
jgi:hypothetical protein